MGIVKRRLQIASLVEKQLRIIVRDSALRLYKLVNERGSRDTELILKPHTMLRKQVKVSVLKFFLITKFTTRVIKTRRVRWKMHVASMVER